MTNFEYLMKNSETLAKLLELARNGTIYRSFDMLISNWYRRRICGNCENRTCKKRNGTCCQNTEFWEDIKEWLDDEYYGWDQG